VRSRNWFSVSMFLALASISRQISLNTMSLLPIFASSIRSLQAMYRISFMSVRFLLFVSVFSDDVYVANSLRHENNDQKY
jgi:hypothetical protein